MSENNQKARALLKQWLAEDEALPDAEQEMEPMTTPDAQQLDSSDYYQHALDLTAETLRDAPDDKLIEKRVKLMAIITNAVHYWRQDFAALQARLDALQQELSDVITERDRQTECALQSQAALQRERDKLEALHQEQEQLRQENKELLARVDSLRSDRPTGSTAATD